MMKHAFRYLLLPALTLPVLGSLAHGQIVIQHVGANDPETEGFVLDAPDQTNLELGPVFDDLGRDAWMMNADSAAVFARYTYFLSGQERADALTYGWEVSATLRIVEPGSQALNFYIGTERFRASFGLNANGFPWVGDSSGTSYTLDDSDGGYHSYSLVYDALEEVANLWVDGTDTGLEFSSRSSTVDSHLMLTTTDGPSHIHWNEFSLTVIPEPGTYATIAGILALAGTLCFRRRRTGTARKAM